MIFRMNDSTKEMLDIFAALAMQEFLRYDINVSVDNQKRPKWVAEQSYKVARAMLNERNKIHNSTTSP